MSTLEKLTKEQLLGLFNEYGISSNLAKGKIIEQIKAKVAQSTINSHLENFSPKKKATVAKKSAQLIEKEEGTKPSDDTIIKRIEKLEQQMIFIINKLDSIESKIAKITPNSSTLSNFDLEAVKKIKKRIIDIIAPRMNKSIDEICTDVIIKDYPFQSVEQAILELIDEELFDRGESRSSKKVNGNIGRIIRR